jgi:hypothetical protein
MSLAIDWIKSAELQLKHGVIQDSHAEPIVNLLEMCDKTPREALNIIYEIISNNPSDEVLGYLGAGPLEEILAANCEQFIEELIGRSKNDERLLLCLRSVDLDDSTCKQAQHFYDALSE